MEGKGLQSPTPSLWTPVPHQPPKGPHPFHPIPVPCTQPGGGAASTGEKADFLSSLLPTLCDLLFNFTGPSAFMRVIYKAPGFDVQHKKANSCVRKCHRD